MVKKKSADIDKEVHDRIKLYGNWGETISQVIDRALDEAGAPDPKDE